MHVYIYIYTFVHTVWCTVNVYRFPAKSGMPRRLRIVPFTTQNWKVREKKKTYIYICQPPRKRTATSLLFRKLTLKKPRQTQHQLQMTNANTIFKKYATTAECHAILAAIHSNSDPPHRPALARPSVTVVDSPRAISILASPKRSPTCSWWSLKGIYIDIIDIRIDCIGSRNMLCSRVYLFFHTYIYIYIYIHI